MKGMYTQGIIGPKRNEVSYLFSVAFISSTIHRMMLLMNADIHQTLYYGGLLQLLLLERFLIHFTPSSQYACLGLTSSYLDPTTTTHYTDYTE